MELVSLAQARAGRELMLALGPPEISPAEALCAIENELREMFESHPESHSALAWALGQVRQEVEAGSERLHVAFTRFEELLEALVSRHGLWEEGP